MDTLIKLFWAFFQIGLFSIGGGYAAIPLIESQVIDSYHWMTANEFTDLITISQMTPGPIAINSASFIGTRMAGVPGALVATLGCVLPSCVIVLLIAWLYRRYSNLRLIDGALKGLRPAVVGMIATAALTMLHQTGQVIRAVSQLGLTVRGLYGEGSEASGQLYQLSNQITLGRTEDEILKLLSDTADQVIQRERTARELLMEHTRLQVTDKLMRSWGEFTNARLMTNKEFLARLSDARLASDLGLIPVSAAQLNKLMGDVQPATLERNAGRTLKSEERDELRAEIIRKTLA